MVALGDRRGDLSEELTRSGVRSGVGEHEIDMLVLATGFDAVSGSMLRIDPTGRGGIALRERWSERFETCLGMMVGGFPNMFMIHGPTSPGVLYTMPLGGERQTEWIESVITHLDENGLGAIEPTEDAEIEWDREVAAMADRTLYPRTRSWYMGANVPGKPRQFLAHVQGSQYFNRLTEVAESGFPGFAVEARR